MTNENGEERLVRNARQVLDASTDELDPHILARLRGARARAVEAATGRHLASTSRWLVPAGGLAAFALAAVAFLTLQHRPAEVIPLLPNGDIELLTAAEPLELIENLEFYEWLEAEASDAG